MSLKEFEIGSKLGICYSNQVKEPTPQFSKWNDSQTSKSTL